jgi:hypothetical protein
MSERQMELFIGLLVLITPAAFALLVPVLVYLDVLP